MPVMSHLVERLRLVLRCMPIIFALIGGAAGVQAQEWAVNKSKSEIAFELTAGGERVAGSFQRYKTEIRLDPEDPEGGEIAILLDMTSAQTGDAKWDALLQSPDWFDSASHPTARLRFTAGRSSGDTIPGTADVAVKGATIRSPVPIALDYEGGEGTLRAEVTLSREKLRLGTSDPAAAGNDALRIAASFTAKFLDN